jgi:hypothetical protein
MTGINYGYTPANASGIGLTPASASPYLQDFANWNTPAPSNYSFAAPAGSYSNVGLQMPGTANSASGLGIQGGLSTMPTGPAMATAPANPNGWSWLGTRDQQGVAGLALGGATALGSLYLGMQQYNLAKDTLANNKAQFERNYAANKTTTNANLEDRQRARVASNAGAYQSVGDYMNQNGVK